MIHYNIKLRVLAIALTSCAGGKAIQTGGETGYPTGQIQRELVFYAGRIWGVDFYGDSKNGKELETLPDEYKLAGKTIGNDSYNVPTEEFHTSQLSDGIEVWAIPGSYRDIYLKFPDSEVYRRFLMLDEKS